MAYRLVPFPVTWMTLKVISLLQDLSNAIRRTFFATLLFQLTWRVARSLGDS